MHLAYDIIGIHAGHPFFAHVEHSVGRHISFLFTIFEQLSSQNDVLQTPWFKHNLFEYCSGKHSLKLLLAFSNIIPWQILEYPFSLHGWIAFIQSEQYTISENGWW